MIQLRNQADFVLELAINGTQTTTAGGTAATTTSVVPFDCYLAGVLAVLGTAGVTGTQTTDLLQNTASLVGSGTLLSYATTATVPTYNTAGLTTNPPLFSKGDILTLTNATIHSGTAAINQSVLLLLKRQRGSSAFEPTQGGTVDVPV